MMPMIQNDHPNDVGDSEMKTEGMMGAYMRGLESPQLKVDLSKMFPEFLYKGYLDWRIDNIFVNKVSNNLIRKSAFNVKYLDCQGTTPIIFRACDLSSSILPMEIYHNVRLSLNNIMWSIALIKGKGCPQAIYVKLITDLSEVVFMAGRDKNPKPSTKLGFDTHDLVLHFLLGHYNCR